jgi:hypothetical protein
MIKLEDLKIGDRVYGIAEGGLGLYEESIVVRELFNLDIGSKPEVVQCKGGFELIGRKYQEIIFRTEIEALEALEQQKLKLAKELLSSSNFLDRLYECATTSKRLDKYSERPIYKIVIKLYNESINNKE